MASLSMLDNGLLLLVVELLVLSSAGAAALLAALACAAFAACPLSAPRAGVCGAVPDTLPGASRQGSGCSAP
eukprot:10658935-Alexandrium_andersonii.AAC.1